MSELQKFPKKWRSRLATELSRPVLRGDRGLFVADRELFAYAAAREILRAAGPVVLLAESIHRAEELVGQLEGMLTLCGAARRAQLLPEVETDRRHLMPEHESERSRIMSMTAAGDGVFVASALGALARTASPARFRRERLCLRVGDTEWPPERLAHYLVDLDYDNEAEVHLPGEFSWRGGILDLYSPAQDYPCRLDYFGAELESIRLFDPETQRSRATLDEVTVIPRGDAALLDPDGEYHCFLDFVADRRPLLIVSEREAIEEHLRDYGQEEHREGWRRLLAGDLPRLFLERPETAPDLPEEMVVRARCFALAPEFRAMLPELERAWDTLHRQVLHQQLERWHDQGYEIVFCCSSQSKVEHLHEQLREDERLAPLAGHTVIAELPSGMFFPDSRLAILSDAELYGTTPTPPRRIIRGHFHGDHLLRSGSELTEGDFAVHAAHGICRYLGIKREVDARRDREVLVLEFADDVKVYVPLEQACLVSRYVGAAKKAPQLSKIGGSRWKAAKDAALDAVRDLAAEMLRVQAIRAAGGGQGLPVEAHEYEAFADAFPFTETEDQQRTIREVIDDLAAARPMDRLICGDVGFGKTEVAMRAAFVAVMAGKQVAVLVPTTVLCQQHYLSFRERLKEYPITIENLSRFRTGSEQNRVLQGMASGGVDIVIGTHRLLSGDVRFHDLGLFIVDEEQRFGVAHKERLKQLRADIDVLTMTATPIPRTLYLSMSGIRDMSTIMTAPEERLPVHTVVAQYDDVLIREALRRELQREGQVFFLHNRVKTITAVRDKLKRLVPEARFDIGHGQMGEHELEAAMLRFIEGQTDVLVCTTIIESGLDIPNANTIIIDRADRFGLAELYQLRGRVGRYHHQAYAYLLLPKGGVPSGDARERLAAMRRYTHLGSGFRLALRDLQIRGSGNILGREQSGHITAVGFDLYCQLLREAVARLKKQPLPRRPEVSVDLFFIAYGQPRDERQLSVRLDEQYIVDADVRVDLYRRLGQLSTVAQVDDFAAELADRFGPVPTAAERLLAVARIRILAATHGLHAVTVRDERIMLEGARGHLKARGSRFPRLEGNDRDAWLAQIAAWIERLTA